MHAQHGRRVCRVIHFVGAHKDAQLGHQGRRVQARVARGWVGRGRGRPCGEVGFEEDDQQGAAACFFFFLQGGTGEVT